MAEETEINGKLDALIDTVDNIEALLIGDAKDAEKVGLIERMRTVEKWIAKREWFEKIIIGAISANIIATFIGLIFLLIQNSIAK